MLLPAAPGHHSSLLNLACGAPGRAWVSLSLLFWLLPLLLALLCTAIWVAPCMIELQEVSG